MRSSTFLAVFAALIATTFAWSKFFDNSYDVWAPSRNVKCVGSAAKCFASGECCKGYVCAAFGDLFSRHPEKRIEKIDPEVPGYCVLEKDLHPCDRNADCSDDARCVALGRNKERYCIERSTIEAENEVKPKSRFSGKAKLGQECAFDGDCVPYSADGKELCCQDVRRFRQKAKRICDRLTPMSRCNPN